jgi:hypothetical protein
MTANCFLLCTLSAKQRESLRGFPWRSLHIVHQ